MDRTPYFQRWVIMKESKGYIFREVRSNLGISGHFPSIRALVIDALLLLGDGLVVTIEA
jgi:hypothetical protein